MSPVLLTFISRVLPLTCIALVGSLILSACSDSNHLADLPQEAQVDSGVDFLRVFNFDEAYKVLSNVQPTLSRADVDWELATYSLALAAWHKAPPSNKALDEARSLLKSVVEAAPESELAASALLDLGRIAEVSDFLDDPTDVPTAQAYYRQVIDKFPDTEMAARAAAFLAQTLAQTFEREQIKSAIALLDDVIDAQPDSLWLGVLLQYKAQLYAFYLDDYGAALEPYMAAVEIGLPRASEADASLWQIALFAEEAEEYLVAAEMYAQLVSQFPRSVYGAYAHRRIAEIADMFPEAGIVIPAIPQRKFSH